MVLKSLVPTSKKHTLHHYKDQSDRAVTEVNAV